MYLPKVTQLLSSRAFFDSQVHALKYHLTLPPSENRKSLPEYLHILICVLEMHAAEGNRNSSLQWFKQINISFDQITKHLEAANTIGVVSVDGLC